MSMPSNPCKIPSKDKKLREHKENKTSKVKWTSLPNDAVVNIFTFLDMQSITRMASVSNESQIYYINVSEQEDFWRTRVFQDLTEFPTLRWHEAYRSFYSRNCYLINRIEKASNSTHTSHTDWVALFADVMRHGFEKLIPRFSKKITNYAELCDAASSPTNTYLHLAAINGHAHIIKFLLQHNVPVDPIDGGYCYMPSNITPGGGVIGFWSKQLGYTPLTYTAMHGFIDCMVLLLDYGANANFQSYGTGSTPLHEAAKNGYLGCFKVLIKRRANHNISDTSFFKKTALDLAKKNDTPEWREYLQNTFNITITQPCCIVA